MQENRQEKSLIKQNILQYIKYKGITEYKFYQLTGITRGILKQDNGISEENTAKFLAYFSEVNANWLITGEGDMLKAPDGGKNVATSITDAIVQQGISISGDNNSFNPNDLNYLHNILKEKDVVIAQKEQYIIKLRKQLDEMQQVFNSRGDAKDAHYQSLAEGLRKIISDKECMIKNMLNREQDIIRNSYERNKENTANFNELRKEKDVQIDRLLNELKAKDERIEKLIEKLLGKP